MAFNRITCQNLWGESVRSFYLVEILYYAGAREGTRTPTGIPLDPKSSASASSATLASHAYC